MTTVACTIAGPPRATDPEHRDRAKPWRDAIAGDLRRARAGRNTITAPVVVNLVFRFKLPAKPRYSWQRAGGPHGIRPSVPHLTATVFDALLDAGVIADLDQVDDLAAKKLYARPGEGAGTLIVLSLVDGDR